MAGGKGKALSRENILKNTFWQTIPDRGSSWSREGKGWGIERAEGHCGPELDTEGKVGGRMGAYQLEMQRQATGDFVQ